MQSYRGAALLTERGGMFTGSSLESATSAMLSVSAEKSAVLKAVSEGERGDEEEGGRAEEEEEEADDTWHGPSHPMPTGPHKPHE